MNIDFCKTLCLPLQAWEHVQGDAQATVTLITYGRYTCFNCAQLHFVIQAIQHNLTGNFPEAENGTIARCP